MLWRGEVVRGMHLLALAQGLVLGLVEEDVELGLVRELDLGEPA